MSGFSNYSATQFLGYVKGSAPATAPTAVYCSLHNGDPGDDGTGGTEVTTTISSGNRIAITFGAVTAKAIANSATVDFGTAAAAGTVDYFGVWDAATGGNFIGGAALATARTVAIGNPISFDVGALTVGL